MVWYSHLFKNFPQFFVIHTVKGFSVVNEADIDVFLELSCLFYDPMDVSNLIINHSFTIGTFVCKVMPILFNILSRFVTAFLARSKCLLISWLPSLSAVILEPKKILKIENFKVIKINNLKTHKCFLGLD